MEAKINRAAFLYMEPKKAKHKAEHAQCSTCMMWTGAAANTCTIHGKIKVTGDMSCGLYVEGDPMPEMAGEEHASVTPETSGLAKLPVRCENCHYIEEEENECYLFEMLNENKHFDLDEHIKPKGCCNAFIPMEPSIEGLRKKAAKL